MANTKGSDNPFPSVLFAEHVDPANPPADFQRLFVDTDHLLKLRDSSGTVVTFQTSSGGTGTLATVEEADASPTDSAVTKLVVPNGWLAIASHVATIAVPATTTYLTSGPVTLAASNTFYDAVSSASLAAGTYLVSGSVLWQNGVVTHMAIKLHDGTNVYFNTAQRCTATGAYFTTAVPAVVVVLSGTATLKISVASNDVSSGTCQIEESSAVNGTTEKATFMTVVRLA